MASVQLLLSQTADSLVSFCLLMHTEKCHPSEGQGCHVNYVKKLQLDSGTPSKSTRRVERSVCAVPVDAPMHAPHISAPTNSTVEVYRFGHSKPSFLGSNGSLMPN